MRVFLKKGRERPVLNGHPWIFSGAIEKTEEDSGSTAIADVFDSRGNWLARGLYNTKSQIRVRILTWEKEEIDSFYLLLLPGEDRFVLLLPPPLPSSRA